jgi:hypothetical protein
LDYINGLTWSEPATLDTWIKNHQKQVPEKSTHVIQKIEMILMSAAFLSLILWLYERLFNPNWSFWN